MAAKLDSLTLDEQLIHKCMANEGVAFRKQVVQLKKDPTYKDLLLITRFDEKEKIMGGDQGCANATLTAGDSSTGGHANKPKKEGFVNAFHAAR